MSAADRVDVERLGGFAGFGLPGSRLRSRGSVASAALSAADRRALEALFAQPPAAGITLPDAFRYRLTRHRAGAAQTIEVAEDQLPEALSGCVHDELA